MKRACYFGIYDPAHYRSKVIMRGLTKAGYEVVECNVDPRKIKGLRKYLVLRRKFEASKDKGFDVIVVGFPGYLTVFLAVLLSSSIIILDSYISYFDGVRDRKDLPIYHPKVIFAWIIDYLNGVFADVILTINFTYRDFFINTLKVSKTKVEVLHKGADESIFHIRDNLKNNPSEFAIGWWGSFIPLHGVDVILGAANVLKYNHAIKFTFIGRGQLFSEIEKQIKYYQLNNIVLKKEFIPAEDLAKRISEYDVALGIFSTSPKAGRCVTNKVYEAMAMGKALITQNSIANKEIFIHKNNAYLVPPGNPQALADGITDLFSDKKLRKMIGENASKLFKDNFTINHLEKEFVGILEKHRL